MSDGFHYWLFEAEGLPLPVQGLRPGVFTSLDDAREAASRLGRAIDIKRTPVQGGADEYVESVIPTHPGQSTSRRASVTCQDCGQELDEPSHLSPDEREPCPNCGSRARKFEVRIESRVGASSGETFGVPSLTVKKSGETNTAGSVTVSGSASLRATSTLRGEGTVLPGGQSIGVYRGVTLRLVDLPLDQSVLSNKSFRSCTLVGPGVLIIESGVEIGNCSFDAPLDEIFWNLGDVESRKAGAIVVRDCSFRDCEFHNVGFSGGAELLAALKSASGTA